MRCFGIQVVAFVLPIIAVLGCSRYTAPSPLDGRWQVKTAKNNNTAIQYPFNAQQVVYWDFLNVLYMVSYHDQTHTPLITYEWGNAYFHEDSIILVREKQFRNKPFPFPTDMLGSEIRLKFKRSNNSVVLENKNGQIRMDKH